MIASGSVSLLVIHGLGRHAHEWSAWARALDADALVPDLPELRRIDGKPDFSGAIAELLALLDEHAIERTTWLGHSGGGHLALDAAIEHPHRVDRLVIVSAAASRAKLERVRCPTLVVVGADDELRVDAFAHVQVETIGGCGHDPHLDAAAALAACVKRFVS